MMSAGCGPQHEVIGLATELLLIRHAPSHPPGKLYGRTDVAADVSDTAEVALVRQSAGAVTRWITSPARRCRQTLSAIWGDDTPAVEDARLWEQDFGEWDGRAYSEIPDIGVMKPDTLARHRPPAGESFQDVCERVQPALLDAVERNGNERVAIIAHAGVVRAAVALALGAKPGDGPARALTFDVQPLSITVLRAYASDSFAIVRTNWRPTCA